MTPNGGMAVVALDPWENRTEPDLQIGRILSELRAQFATIPGANIAVFAPPAIPGVGAASTYGCRRCRASLPRRSARCCACWPN